MSEPAKQARGRKPNRFKKVEVKKEETSVKETASAVQQTANLLGDDIEVTLSGLLGQ